MKHCKYILLVCCVLCFSLFLKADTLKLHIDKVRLEITVARGWMNRSVCNQALSMNVGVGNFMVTGRSFRNQYSVFETSVLFGYRFPIHRLFVPTVSIGYSDVAFLKDQYISPRNVIPDHYDKRIGLCLQLEVESRLHINKIPTRWGIAGTYSLNLNGYRNLSVVSVGIKYHLLPWDESGGLFEWMFHNQEKRKQRQAKRDAKYDGLQKNLVRTKILFGLLAGTYLEYERTFNHKVGLSLGVAIHYFEPPGFMFANGMLGPYSYLQGREVNVGVNSFKEVRNGWWSGGVRFAYRHRENKDFYAHAFGNYRWLSMISDDYVAQVRIAYTGRKVNVVKFGWMFSPGIRWSYQLIELTSWSNSLPPYPTGNVIHRNGWQVAPVLNTGVFMCFGW